MEKFLSTIKVDSLWMRVVLMVLFCFGCAAELDTSGRILCGPVSDGTRRCPSSFECRFERFCCPVNSVSCPLGRDANASDVDLHDHQIVEAPIVDGETGQDRLPDGASQERMKDAGGDVPEAIDGNGDSEIVTVDLPDVREDRTLIDGSEAPDAAVVDRDGRDVGPDRVVDTMPPDVRIDVGPDQRPDVPVMDACDAPPGCTCSGPVRVCAGTCVDTQSDPLHCGRCSRACASGDVCETGFCRRTVRVPARSQWRLSSADLMWDRAYAGNAVEVYPGAEVRSYHTPGSSFTVVRGCAVFPPFSTFLALRGTVQTARFCLMQAGMAGDPLNNVPAHVIHLISFAPAMTFEIRTTDYAGSHWGGTSFGSREYRTFAPGAMQCILFNGEGVRFLQLAFGTTSEFTLGLKTGNDLANIAPADLVPGRLPGLQISTADIPSRMVWMEIQVAE